MNADESFAALMQPLRSGVDEAARRPSRARSGAAGGVVAVGRGLSRTPCIMAMWPCYSHVARKGLPTRRLRRRSHMAKPLQVGHVTRPRCHATAPPTCSAAYPAALAAPLGQGVLQRRVGKPDNPAGNLEQGTHVPRSPEPQQGTDVPRSPAGLGWSAAWPRARRYSWFFRQPR